MAKFGLDKKWLILGGLGVLLAACQNSPDSAYREAKISIAHSKAGVNTPNDPEKLLMISAKGATSKSDIQKYNREYGKYLLEKGKRRQAYQAFETAALAGDSSSQNRLVQGHLNGHYRPSNLNKVARDVYLPAANSGSSVSANMLMAELVGKGRVRGSQFKSESYWLQRAAKKGSTSASRDLAEKAERSGNVKLAASYYAKSDRISRSERALRQARIYYLGQGVKQNTKVAHAWMERARRFDKKGAGELAARVYRSTGGGKDGAYLQSVASAAGVTSSLSSGRIVRDYRAAKTDAERRMIIKPLEKSADQGSADAALVVANLYIRTGGSDAKIAKYLLKAYSGGKTEALDLMITRLQRASPGSSEANSLYKAVASVASKGNVKAARALSSIYSIGGVKQASVSESRKWLRKAADSGDTKSQYEFGVDLFENGNGGSDKNLAVKYLTMAANKGNPFASSYLKGKQ
ncbi:Sel1 repeat [Roseibium album]|nr:Sel1 repeat [Roseibium album]